MSSICEPIAECVRQLLWALRQTIPSLVHFESQTRLGWENPETPSVAKPHPKAQRDYSEGGEAHETHEIHERIGSGWQAHLLLSEKVGHLATAFLSRTALRACLKTPERGRVVLDQPQRASIFLRISFVLRAAVDASAFALRATANRSNSRAPFLTQALTRKPLFSRTFFRISHRLLIHRLLITFVPSSPRRAIPGFTVPESTLGKSNLSSPLNPTQTVTERGNV